jgi:hypothetical protein
MAPSLTLCALRNPHYQAQAALPTDDAFRLTGSDPDRPGRPGRPLRRHRDSPDRRCPSTSGTRLAAGGVPVYPRGVLIRDRRLAAEMAAALGDRPVVLLRGHGLTSVTIGVEQAVLQAISVDRLARLSLRSSVPTARSPICPAPTWSSCPASARRSTSQPPGATSSHEHDDDSAAGARTPGGPEAAA